MAKAVQKSVVKARRQFLDSPGCIDSRQTPDGPHSVWRGGPFGKVLDEIAPVVVWMQNNGELPFTLEWICHCPHDRAWYIKRVDDVDDGQQDANPD